MILLEGHSLTPKRKIRPEALSIKLTERDSSATMTPDGTEGITTESWLKSDNGPGNGTVWRVKSIQQAYHTDTPVIQLEHAINTLKDRILFGEITPAMITGTLGATTCTARQAITYILNQQSDWVLDDFDYDSVSNPYKFDGDTLLDALETVSGTLQDAWWSYDCSTYPFKISITEKSDAVACELRPGRNLRTLSRTIDRGGMYTRFYPIGKNDLHLSPTPYVSKNENLYGVIAKVETDQSIGTAAELTAWANERLDRHAEPEVTITAEGYELSEATGESLDNLQLGTVCRIPLSEFSTVITERITEMNWADAVHAPEDVKITLANKREDATKIIAEAMKKSGRSARTAARRDKEDNAWFEDTDDHVAMCAKGIIGVDASGNPNWTRMSEIWVDGNGIHQHVQSVQGEVVVAQAEIEISEDKISQIVTLNDNRPIRKYASTADFPATGSASYLYYSLADKKYYEWTNGAYAQTTPGKVLNRAGIISTINEDGSSTTSILGDKVYIGSVNKTLQALGTDATNKTGVFADYLYVHSLSASDLTTILANIGDAEITSIDVTDLTVEGDFVASGGTVTINSDVTVSSGVGVRIGTGGTYRDIDNFIADASVSGNTLTLTKADGTTVTFSKTATPVLSGSWSSGTLTVTSNPSATANYKRTLVQKATSWSGNTATAPIYAQFGDSGQYEENTGWAITVDASGIYNNGYDAGVNLAGSSAWFHYAAAAGSNHQGRLAANSYISIGYKKRDGTTVWKDDTTWLTPSGGGSHGSDASNILLGSQEWMSDSAWQSLPSTNPKRQAAELNDIKNEIRDHHSLGTPGWVLFKATISDGTGAKWYRINTQWN